MGEKKGVRENIERYAQRLKETSKGKLSGEQAKAIATKAALRVEHGKK